MERLHQVSYQAFADRVGQHVDSLPDFWVANLYAHSGQRIGEHHDADPLFATDVLPSVIFSFNLQRDTFFVVKPQHKMARALGFCPKKHKDMAPEGWCLPFLAGQGSVLVMGGWFQKYFLHKTFSHGLSE